MSVAGILSSVALESAPSRFQNRMQTARKEFQQLGQDLQSGNLTAAQSDFATLQQMQPQSSASSSTAEHHHSPPITQDFNQLATDLKAGNTQPPSRITRNSRRIPAQPPNHHHHHHSGGADQSHPTAVSQLFSQLGQGHFSPATSPPPSRPMPLCSRTSSSTPRPAPRRPARAEFRSAPDRPHCIPPDAPSPPKCAIIARKRTIAADLLKGHGFSHAVQPLNSKFLRGL